MTDKYSTPVQMWTAAQCARFLGYKNAAQWKYLADTGKAPAPVEYRGGASLWRADEVRRWYNQNAAK